MRPTNRSSAIRRRRSLTTPFRGLRVDFRPPCLCAVAGMARDPKLQSVIHPANLPQARNQNSPIGIPDGPKYIPHGLAKNVPSGQPITMAGSMRIAIAPDGRTVAAGGWTGEQGDRAIYLFDRESGLTLRRIAGLPPSLCRLAWSSDGSCWSQGRAPREIGCTGSPTNLPVGSLATRHESCPEGGVLRKWPARTVTDIGGYRSSVGARPAKSAITPSCGTWLCFRVARDPAGAPLRFRLQPSPVARSEWRVVQPEQPDREWQTTHVQFIVAPSQRVQFRVDHPARCGRGRVVVCGATAALSRRPMASKAGVGPRQWSWSTEPNSRMSSRSVASVRNRYA